MPTPGVPPAPEPAASQVPLGQRLFDNIWLLFVLGVLIMFIVYTGWGLYELMTLPPATLP